MYHLPHILIFVFISSLMACQRVSLPDQVAEEFWLAIKTEDKAAIKKHSTLFWNAELIDQEQLPKIDTFNLGTITIHDNKAEIATTLNLINDDQQTIQLTTYLLKTDGIWRVDYNKTMQGVKPKQFSDAIEELSELGEIFSDEINRSLDELNEAIPKIEEEIGEFEQKLEEGLPKFKQKIDELIKNLEELLSVPEKNPSQESETTEI